MLAKNISDRKNLAIKLFSTELSEALKNWIKMKL
jgi:hypothetical protein